MSFRRCVEDGVRAGEISQEQAQMYFDELDELLPEYNRQMGPGPAQTQASVDAAAATRKKAIERKRAAIMQAQSWKRLTFDMQRYNNKTMLGKYDINQAALALFEEAKGSNIRSVAQLEAVITRSATRKLDGLLKNFRRDLLGRTRKKAQMKNLVKEIFDEGSTDDISAREFAKSWKEVAEYLRKRFNAAGGMIPRRLDWGLPQQHSTVKVRKAGFEEWRNFIDDLLDLEKMIDHETGLPFNRGRLEAELLKVYKTIETDGLSKLKPGANLHRGKALAKRNTDHRFLVFKNGDAWLKYQTRFGNDNPFDVMMGHITTMSRDIAFMERFGPNPHTTKEFLKTYLEQQQPNKPDAAKSTGAKVDELFNIMTGRHNQPVNGLFANTFAGIRQLLQSAQLGAASISALTDVNFQRMARQMNGLPQTSTLKQYINFLGESLPGMSKEEQSQLAIRLGLTAEGWSTLAAGQMRYVGEMSGPEVTRRIADFVMRASFLSPWTQTGKWAFGMEFMGTLADSVGKTFDDLDPALRSSMERYGLNATKWDIMRSTELYDHKGAKFLRAEDIEFRSDIDPRLAREIATDMMSMIETETNFAVPSTSIRGRAALTGDVRPGTFIGELGRSFAMYKNFSVTLMNTHIMRSVAQKSGFDKATAIADLMISTTLFGALALTAKEISKGRDPRSIFDEDGNLSLKFWGAAFLQGGGLGIFGDFFFSNVNRFGGGLTETVAGPVTDVENDLINLTIGNLYEVAQGEDTKAAKEFIDFTLRYTPGSSLWYSRLALERIVVDQVRKWADPDFDKRIRRTIRRYQREYDQNYWWSPGQSRPERAPDLSRIFGN